MPINEESSSSFTADPPRELNILGHDRYPLSVNRAKIRILEQTHKVRLRRLLQSRDGAALEPQIGFEVLSDLADKTLEGELADQKLGALLVLPDLPQRHGSGTEPVRLLHSSGGRSRLPRRLGCELLPRGFASGGFSRGLLGTSHLRFEKVYSFLLSERM